MNRRAKGLIAVTGAGGRLGHFIAAKLRSLGYEIRSLSASCPDGLASADFRSFLAGCQGLVHAAFAHVPGKYRGGEGDDPKTFWALNHSGTVRLLDQAREVGVRRAVLFSSRAVYGATHTWPPEPLDERVEPAPDTLYGELKLAAERLAQTCSDAAMPIIALRPTGVYGGEAPYNKWTPLFEDALKGVFPATNRVSTEVSGETVAAAVALALSPPGAAMGEQVFNLSDGRVALAEILAFAGFDTRALPALAPFQGPELSSARIAALGLVFPGREGLRQAAKALRRELADPSRSYTNGQKS